MRAAIMVGVLAGTLGCGRSATLIRESGPRIEGVIVESDREVIVVEQDGERVRVPRSEVVDIDHPGNVALTYGVMGSAFSVLLIVASVPLLTAEPDDDPEQEPGEATGDEVVTAFANAYGGALLVMGALGLLVHLGPTIWGARAWGASRQAAEPPSTPEGEVSVGFGPGGVLVRF